jgi:hypothetical protein
MNAESGGTLGCHSKEQLSRVDRREKQGWGDAADCGVEEGDVPDC